MLKFVFFTLLLCCTFTFEAFADAEKFTIDAFRLTHGIGPKKRISHADYIDDLHARKSEWKDNKILREEVQKGLFIVTTNMGVLKVDPRAKGKRNLKDPSTYYSKTEKNFIDLFFTVFDRPYELSGNAADFIKDAMNQHEVNIALAHNITNPNSDLAKQWGEKLHQHWMSIVFAIAAKDPVLIEEMKSDIDSLSNELTELENLEDTIAKKFDTKINNAPTPLQAFFLTLKEEEVKTFITELRKKFSRSGKKLENSPSLKHLIKGLPKSYFAD